MPLINASSFLLYKDQTAIGHSKNTVFNLNLDLPESTTKDSGGFAEYLPCLRGGTITVNGLTAYNDTLNFNFTTKKRSDYTSDLFLINSKQFI